jgi:hypothetical protein
MVVSLTYTKALKIAKYVWQNENDHQHFSKNQNSKSDEKGSNVKIDRVENFKDPLNQCTSQNKSWNKTTPHKQQETFEIVQQIHKLRIYRNLIWSKSSL